MTKEFFLDPKLALNIILNRGHEHETYNTKDFWQLLERELICLYLTDDEQGRIYEQIERLNGTVLADRIDQKIRKLVQIYHVTPEIRKAARFFPLEDYESAVEVLCARELGINSLLTHRAHHFEGLGFELFSINDVIRLHLCKTAGLNQQSLLQFRGTQSPSYISAPIAVGTFGHLFVCRIPVTTGEVEIEVRVQASSRQALLPVDLQMKILDQNQRLVMQGDSVLSRSGIGLKFSGNQGESFIAQITGKEINFSRTFTI